MKRKQIMEKIGKRLVQLRKSQRMKNTKIRLQQMYNRLKAKGLKRYTIPFRIRNRQIQISWKWGVFGVIAYAAYLQLEKKEEPVDELQAIYGKRVKRILVINQQLWLNTDDQITGMDAQSHIIHFTPINQQQLTSIVSFCRSRNLHAVPGNYSHVPRKLSQLMHLQSQKGLPLLIINLDQLRDAKINKQFNQITLQMGCKCSKVNKLLQLEGYQPIFMQQFDNLRVYTVISQNLPLSIPLKPQIQQNLINMQMVSTQGINYLSSSQTHIGPGLNLNSLLLGSQGRYSIPAKISFKLTRKKQRKQTKYLLNNQTLNSSESANKIIELKNLVQGDFQGLQTQIQRNSSGYDIIFKQYGNSLFNIKNSVCKIKQSHVFVQKRPHQNQESQNLQLLLSLNQQILCSLMLNQQFNSIDFSYKNNILSVTNKISQNEIRNLCSFLILQGANLVWYRNQQLFNELKKSNQGIESGVQMMKRMKQLREAFDPRRNLSCPDYERIYFKKTLFRRMTQFFW